MELNFTDVSANPSIVFMDTKRCLPPPDEDTAPASPALSPTLGVWGWTRHWLRTGMRRTASMLARAEKHVVENFRVPPNGG